MRSYFKFWKNCLNFKGKTTRGEFFAAVFMHSFVGSVLHLAECLILMLKFDVAIEQAQRGPVFMAYGFVGAIALISMAVRRYRDAGYHRHNAWKLLVPGVIVAALWLPSFEEADHGK